MVIGDPSGGIGGFRLFLISCVMSASSSPVALQRASFIFERVRDLLDDLPDPLLPPPQDLGPRRTLSEAKPGAHQQGPCDSFQPIGVA